MTATSPVHAEPPSPSLIADALVDAAHAGCLYGHDFAVPRDDRYFEDYQAGASYDYGTVTITEPQILAFARAFDPQLLHTDPAAAERGPFHGLIASGWHTSAIAMRMFVDHYLTVVASLASPGMDALRWPRPVRAGDRLRLHAGVVSTRVSNSRPDRGIVVTRLELFNQGDENVFAADAVNFIGLRAFGPTIDVT